MVIPEFDDVFREHAPYVWRVLRRLGVAERDADDVSQEVFVVVLDRLADFEGRSRLRTWIYGICIRVAADYRKRSHVRREAVTDAVPEGVEDPAQEDALDRARKRAELDAILDGLDDPKRAVVVLFEIEQLPMDEVAAAVGCPVQTAYSRLYKAREEMRAALARRALTRRSG